MEEEIGYFSKLKTILFKPSEFFNSIKSTENINEALKFLALNLLITGLISALFFSAGFLFVSFTSPLTLTNALPFQSLLLLSTPLLLLIFLIVIPLFLEVLIIPFMFVNSLVLHLFVKLFKGEGEFADTFNIGAYGTALFLPGIILGLIPIIGGLAIFVWQIIILILGISILHNISKLRSFFVLVTRSLVIFGLIFLSMYLLVGNLIFSVPISLEGDNINIPIGESFNQNYQNTEKKLGECYEKTENGISRWCYDVTDNYGGSYGSCAEDKNICEEMRIGEKAILLNDENLCNQVSDLQKNNCFLNFVAVNPKREVCDKITDDYTKSQCIARIAVSLKDINLCESAPDKDTCYYEIGFGFDGKNLNACDKITNPERKESCKFFANN